MVKGENVKERERLDLPGHKCRPVARVVPLMPGRDLWMGELTEPYPGFEHETHCLHITTPHKSVVFGVYRGDFDLLAALGSITGSRIVNARWLDNMAATFRKAIEMHPPRYECTADEYEALARQLHDSIAEGQTVAETATALRLLAIPSEAPGIRDEAE